jgi:thioredoxin 1
MTTKDERGAVGFVNELNFDEEVTRSRVPVLVDVSATWCAPCRAARPVVEALAREHHGKIKVVEIDGDESPELVGRLGVRGFPTFIAFANGRVIDRRAGFGGRRPLEELASALLGSQAEARV